MNLQQLVDQLAGELGRPAAIMGPGPDGRPLAASSAAGADGAATTGGRAGGTVSDIRAARGARPRSGDLVVPVRDGFDELGSFRFDGGDASLRPGEYALVDAAATIARSLIGAASPVATGTAPRDSVMGRLLDDDPHVRRAAFAEAAARHWIDRGGRTVVHALLLDDSIGTLQRVAFGRHLAAAAPTHTTFIRDLDSALYLVTRDARDDVDLGRFIRDESARSGLPLTGIGSARLDPAADDLGDCAEQALVAADLTAALPELQPSSRISDLGGWVLLHSVGASSRRLADISPAAELLCRSGDSVQRQTIETYLDAGGQVRTACERLHIHRTTLYYRLDNMPEVVRDALDDGLKRSTLHLSLKLIRLWEATGAL